jgi:hypothetical protein
MFKTKKAAREAGYRTESDLSRSVLAVRRDAMPTIVKGEKFFAPDQCERLLSRTADGTRAVNHITGASTALRAAGLL